MQHLFKSLKNYQPTNIHHIPSHSAAVLLKPQNPSQIFPNFFYGQTVKRASHLRQSQLNNTHHRNIEARSRYHCCRGKAVGIMCILLGISPASNFGKPTFRNPVSVPSSRTSHPALEDGTDTGFRNVGLPKFDAGEIPKRIHTTL
jgi:hypothetical protein